MQSGAKTCENIVRQVKKDMKAASRIKSCNTSGSETDDSNSGESDVEEDVSEVEVHVRKASAEEYIRFERHERR